MNKYEVLIKKNPNGDTRTAPKDVNFGQFQVANDMHINDVASVMLALGMMLNEKGKEHDLTKKAYEDVNLLDIIEMIVDCVCSGEVRSLEISEDILKLAVENTVKLIDDMVEVEDEQNSDN